MKKILMVSAIAMAIAAPALAEDTKTPKAASPEASVSFVTVAAAEDRRTSEWIGAPVKNANDETVGDINDFVMGSDGKITAIVAGVGGFLGLGEKNVGLPFDSVELSQTSDGKRVAMVNVSKDELMNAPDFKSGDKTMRERAKEASDAAAKTYEQAKENVKSGYEAAKQSAKETYDAAKEAASENYKAAKDAVTNEEPKPNETTAR